MVKIIMGRNLGVAAQATSVAIIITKSNRKGFTLAALAVVIIISNCSLVPRPALVATMAIMSIELLTTFARASYYALSMLVVVVILELAAKSVAAVVMTC